MACSKVAFSIYVFSFAFFSQIAIGANSFQLCNNTSGNFTSKTTYEGNLNRLLRDLSSRAPIAGFSLGSVGHSAARVFGLSQCRGNVSKADCAACFMEATRDIRKLCPNRKAAMVWYDNCFVRYSDSQFSGTVNNRDNLILTNTKNASETDEFVQSVTALLAQLSQKASISPKLFAAGETHLGKSQKVFGMVDCTRDLSRSSCKFCVDSHISSLRARNDTIGNKIGVRIFTPSCNIRFETFPFFNA